MTREALRQSFLCGIMGMSAIALMVAGCASGTKIAQNPKGSVYLEEISDWSFEATHPAVIDQITIMKIIKGLYSDDSQSGSSRMSAGGSKPMRVFSDEDAEFLSPLLAQGLSKAKPEQLVGFRVSSSAGSGSEPTTGSLYVQNGYVYVTIGKSNKALAFIPESAARSQEAPKYAPAGAVTMAIDYHALARAPMPAALPVAKAAPKAPAAPIAAPTMAAAPAQAQPVSNIEASNAGESDFMTQKLSELGKAKDALAKKDVEINMLRKESEWMKRELRERDEELKALRISKVSAKPTAKKRTAEAVQTR